MATETINTKDIPNLAKELRKKVRGLLFVYFLLISVTVLCFLAIVAGGVCGAFMMFQDGSFDIRAIVLIISIIVVAGICVKVVLSPLLRMFDRKEHVGTEIKRQDYPELFSLIDEVVEKAECDFPRKVYIYNECNAFVNSRSIWGHIFKARKDLTIGLPLLYTLNKTELKAILSHEFGHFTQKSISVNTIANLSEFICHALGESLGEIEDADSDSYESRAKWFAALATKIMARQYRRVAPLNGKLSRAQEFEADTFSYSIAGSEATISALSKISYFSSTWYSIMGLLSAFVKEKRRPEDIYGFVKKANDYINRKSNHLIDNETLLTGPERPIKANVMLDANTETHPEMTERCDAIRALEPVPTIWDKTSAMDYFEESTVRKHFEMIPNQLTKVIFPLSSVTFLKKNVTEEELDAAIAEKLSNYLQHFYKTRIFIDQEAWPKENEVHPEYEECPFTKEAALKLIEFNRDANDHALLEQIDQQSSSGMVFTYFGKLYNGKNVPIKEHKELMDRSYEEAKEVAKHCNYWLLKHTKGTELEGDFNLLCTALATIFDLMGLGNAMEVVSHIYQTSDTSKKADEYVMAVDEEYRRYISRVMAVNENNQSVFATIAQMVNAKDKVTKSANSYYLSQAVDLREMLSSYTHIGNTLNKFIPVAWDKIAKELVR